MSVGGFFSAYIYIYIYRCHLIGGVIQANQCMVLADAKGCLVKKNCIMEKFGTAVLEFMKFNIACV